MSASADRPGRFASLDCSGADHRKFNNPCFGASGCFAGSGPG
jgi:hypothetical protein